MSEEKPSRIRLGMVGGGKDAFIGAVHRIASRIDDQFELVAGALSSTPERARESGPVLGLAEPVLATTYAYLLFGERPAGLAIAGIVLVLGAIGVVIMGERRVARAGPPAAD